MATATAIEFILAVVFVATLVRSTFGFGEALVAVPLLALRLPVRVAAPLATLVSVTVAAVILLQDRESVHLRSASGLLAASLVGIPCGLLLLTFNHPAAVKLGLGGVILAYALYTLLAPSRGSRRLAPWAKSARRAAQFGTAARPREETQARPQPSAAPAWGDGAPSRREHKRDARRSRAGTRAHRMPRQRAGDQRVWLLLCGFAAGVLGGAYGMNGPPLVIYGSLRRWPPAQFRATLQAYFLPASLLGLGGFWLAGILTRAVWQDYLIALPALALALPLGGWLHRRLSARSWAMWVHAGLALLALVLIGQVLRAG